jgi:predicted DNA-binding WGR domain protein
MAISEHVTEFAGLPVEEYDPAVGIVLPLMPRRVLRSGDQIWAVTLEGDRLTAQSGKVGTAGRANTKKFRSPEEAQAQYRKLVAEKVAAGLAAPAPAAREFQLVEGKSAKFWAIEVAGEQYTVRFGRIGTAGQTQSKEFDSPAEAR